MSPAQALCLVAWATALLAPLPVHAEEARAPSTPSTASLDDADLHRLVEAAELWGLASEAALLVDAPRQRLALREVDAIDEQHIIAHVLGALSAAGGVAAISIVGAGASVGIPRMDPRIGVIVPGALVGLAAVTGAVIAIALHVDARDRWRRWNLLLTPMGGELALRF